MSVAKHRVSERFGARLSSLINGFEASPKLEFEKSLTGSHLVSANFRAVFAAESHSVADPTAEASQ